MSTCGSWGNTFNFDQSVHSLLSRFEPLPIYKDMKLLPYGRGRSYGDVCLNEDNVILPTKWLDKYIEFDMSNGAIRCEAGVCLQDLISLIIPHGYFVPVTPGTKYVTVGGMVANDVHGKNHHYSGAFGCHVSELKLSRSESGSLTCSTSQNAELFNATIGGIGLTGLITEVEFKLKRIVSADIDQEVIPFESISQFIQITSESDGDWEYTVAWIDSLSGKSKLGRGVFFRGNHSKDSRAGLSVRQQKKLKIPFNMPGGLLNPKLLEIFNRFYHSLHKKGHKQVNYDKFFYPLDNLLAWNRIYGKRGFYQYQCVVPENSADTVLTELLAICDKYHAGSFLSVLKKFGDKPSPGMLSFPRAGYTLALDFPNTGNNVRTMMDQLDKVVTETGGAVYPAKDARMKANAFKTYYPQWQEFSQYIDPAFSSSFWRRVMMEV